MSEKPEGVETWKTCGSHWIVSSATGRSVAKFDNGEDRDYCLHAAQRLPVVEAENRTLRNAGVVLDEKLTAAQARIAMLKEALRDVVTISDRKHEAWDRAKALLETQP